MASLSSTPPAFSPKKETLKSWGELWRAGTKTRGASSQSDDEEGGDDQVSEDAEDTDSDETTPSENPDGVTADGPSSDGEATEEEREGTEADPAAADTTSAPVLPPSVNPSTKYPDAFTKKQGMDFGLVFDMEVGKSLSSMLGGIKVHEYKGSKRGEALMPKYPDCVEVGPARVVGGIRPQNFDVAYRPDGPRIVYDSKTLNDTSSVRKNWQNMINDLGTEATTVHSRFPYAVVAFLVAIPKPALLANQEMAIIRTLERLGTRRDVDDPQHLAESIALVVWDPDTGEIDATTPPPGSLLRVEGFMERIHTAYVSRYKGLPPHDK